MHEVDSEMEILNVKQTTLRNVLRSTLMAVRSYMHAAFAYIILFINTLILTLFLIYINQSSAVLTKSYTSHCLKHKGLHSLHTKHRLNTQLMIAGTLGAFKLEASLFVQ